MNTSVNLTSLLKRLYPLLVGIIICLIMSSHVYAHLMVAQKGTINFTQKGAFLVLSLPVSAFDNIDDDGDGKMSVIEFSKYRSQLGQIIQKQVKLVENKAIKSLQGLMLSPVLAHRDKSAPTEQIVIMGKFPIEKLHSDFAIWIGLFGKKTAEQSLTIRAKHINKLGKHRVVLTPQQQQGRIFPIGTLAAKGHL